MPGAVIVADQSAGAGAGSPGVARRDLWQARAVSLYLGVGGNTTYLWELLTKPTGSAAVLTSSTASTSGFTPDLVGTYRVRLTVNGGGPGNVQTRVYRCRYNNVGALASRGWAVPAYGETAAEANYDANAIGYGEVFETIFADILANLGGGGGATPTGTGIPHVVGGAQQAAASLIVDADVHASAAIAASKVVQATGTGIPHVVAGALNAASSLIVDADVHAAAAVAVSKLAPGTNGQVLTTSGGAATWGAAAGSTPTGTGIPHVVGGVQDAASSLIVDADVHASAAIAASKVVQATGTGIPHVVGGVLASASSLITNADVDAAAAIALSKLAGFGTGVETFLGTPSSANLRAALTDETGTGGAVFATSPTLTTPQMTNPVINGQTQGAAIAVAAMEIDWSLGPVQTKTLAAGANTFTFANQGSGQVLVVRVTGAASTLTWPTIKWAGGVAPTQTASGTDVYTFVHDGTSIYGSVVQAMA